MDGLILQSGKYVKEMNSCIQISEEQSLVALGWNRNWRQEQRDEIKLVNYFSITYV